MLASTVVKAVLVGSCVAAALVYLVYGDERGDDASRGIAHGAASRLSGRSCLAGGLRGVLLVHQHPRLQETQEAAQRPHPESPVRSCHLPAVTLVTVVTAVYQPQLHFTSCHRDAISEPAPITYSVSAQFFFQSVPLPW